MKRLALPAIKSNLLRLRADLEFLEAGAELLEQKRQFLTEALVTFERDAEALRARVEAELAEAYELLAEALAALGEPGMRRLALAAQPLAPGAVHERSLMGVVVPMFAAAPEPAAPLPAAPGEAGAAADPLAERLRALAPPLAELAALEGACGRLARELLRTRRKLNALESVHIPAHRETIRFIADQLEEREREALFQLKRVQAWRTHP